MHFHSRLLRMLLLLLLLLPLLLLLLLPLLLLLLLFCYHTVCYLQYIIHISELSTTLSYSSRMKNTTIAATATVIVAAVTA
jgi:hypothetical protein